MNIDWTKAPKWAEYAAMDSDGEWYWFEFEPRSYAGQWIGNTGKSEFFAIEDMWESTLTERPK